MSSAAFSLLYLAAAAAAFIAGRLVLPRRREPGGTALCLMLYAVSFWAICDAIELQMPTVAARQLVAQVQYLGVAAVAPLFLHTAWALAGGRRRTLRRYRLVVWGPSALSVLVAWTNPWHGWLWASIEPPVSGSPFALYRYGWWLWLLMAQHYVLMGVAAIVLLRAMRRVWKDFRRSMAVVLVAVTLPWVGNLVSNLKLGPWPGLDWLALSLAVSGPLLAWVVLRGGLLDLLPQPRLAFMKAIDAAVVVVDLKGGVVFRNAAATRQPFNDLAALARALGVASLVKAPDMFRSDLPLGSHRVDVRLMPVSDRWGARAGRLVVLRHAGGPQGARAGRRDCRSDQGEADLLAVCASCQRVRDEQGNWLNVEDYHASHADVQFTHGICGECLTRLYPEVADRAGASTFRSGAARG
ncbi:MAG: hypothetical protein FJW23_04960 [Acidimicrobiia bacterium]|nr:hypothetical protein [Acidimicrobiia bacterium]